MSRLHLKTKHQDYDTVDELAMDRPPYDWEDDAQKCYKLACELIGERRVRQRIIAALKAKGGLK